MARKQCLLFFLSSGDNICWFAHLKGNIASPQSWFELYAGVLLSNFPSNAIIVTLVIILDWPGVFL